jgi:hypothetical protein
MLQQAIIDLGEGSPWPGIFGLIALVSIGITILSVALSPDANTPRKDRPLRHVTTFFAVVAGVSLILGVLTSQL